ncbi:NAD dependent epimerase/dehydratase [Aspergillus campestris IBT 28561]|uniref:NAD dependent epimerase/dehydratase n=1 Tax=Aspergillus campestris (strain IBT 28561) TaxID=1392248 RepID=A0A2I1CTV9_ASPC2|nr:NAD dependent epimerase/dehydratase [Aspergillus campestris IBT 28561]PKY01049.1 NAD dependent epimerase/dehydratase [Aspergillus campestris IBT 28561]
MLMREDQSSSNGYHPAEINRVEEASSDSLEGVRTILVTGAAGFIGGWFVRRLIETYGDRYVVVCFDNLGYCASMDNFRAIRHLHNFHFIKGDVCSFPDVDSALRKYAVNGIVHFAARSHVDASFDDPLSFTQTNVAGTQTLLEAARRIGSIRRFVYVSTDEVYGENDASGPRGLAAFTEDDALHPTNPYSASKAAAEMIVQAYRKSFHMPFHMPVIVTRCNNVFGPYQYPEKLIPKLIMHLQKGQKIPIHGNGQSARAFVFAEDAAEALDIIFHRGEEGETYNISSDSQLRVREVAEEIFRVMYRDCHQNVEDWIVSVPDRPFNDSMYWTDDSKLRALGWVQKTGFEEALGATIEWFCRESDGFWPELRGMQCQLDSV